MVEENVGLKSEIEALEAEIAEVQDTFRYKIRKKQQIKDDIQKGPFFLYF